MKRILDILLILLFLPFCLPLFLATLVLVRLKLGSPVFFRQVRAGRDGKPFEIIKFRSMINRVDASGKPLPDAERLTPFGRRLRGLSLDELPEIWNVVRGEMSLVGPRPLPLIYVDRYTAEQRRRLHCTPGITGWAQVNGRNALDWESRFRHDLWYVDHQSVWLDLRILWMTLATVLSRKGISGEGSVTMLEFMGSSESEDASPGPDALPPGSRDPSRKSE